MGLLRVVRRAVSEARPECAPCDLALLGLLDRLLLVVVRLLAPVLLAVVRRDPRVLRLLVVLPLHLQCDLRCGRERHLLRELGARGDLGARLGDLLGAHLLELPQHRLALLQRREG